jgi:hypothetical protein
LSIHDIEPSVSDQKKKDLFSEILNNAGRYSCLDIEYAGPVTKAVLNWEVPKPLNTTVTVAQEFNFETMKRKKTISDIGTEEMELS